MTEINSFPIGTITFNELDPITDAQATNADGVLLFDESVGVMKRMTRGELFKNKVTPIDSIAEFPDLDTDALSDRQQFNLGSFAPDGEDGGGIMLWEPDQPKSLHDGINYFSPTVPIPADFDNPTDVANYRAGVGEEWPAGNGIFVLNYFVSRSEFEALENRQTDTVITLAELSLAVGSKVSTKGCLAIGDGGHGTFIVTDVEPAIVDGYSAILMGNGNWAVLQQPYNILQFGADGTGVTSSNAAADRAIATGKHITVPSGSYNLSSVKTGYWFVDMEVYYTGTGYFIQAERGVWAEIGGGANFHRLRDRVFIGDGGDYNGNKFGGVRSWVGSSAAGNLSYFDTRSQMTSVCTFGGLGAAFSSRSSDSDRTTEKNTIGLGAIALNDQTDFSTTAWGIYGSGVRFDTAGSTHGIEIDVANLGSVIDIGPYNMAPVGLTAGLWVGSGGEYQTSGMFTLTNPSAAMGIITTGGAPGWRKGIVYSRTCIDGTDGVTGNGIAMEMAKGHDIVWKYADNVNSVSGKIVSNNANAATHQYIEFGASNFNIRGVQSDLTTPTLLMRVQALTLTAGQDTNYLFVNPSATGSGTVSLQSAGIDNNSSLILSGKGTGGVTLRDGNNVPKVQVNTTGIGFYNTAPAAKPTVTGSKGGNAALASLITALATLGLITDSTT